MKTQIIRAAEAGFCFGVERAVGMLEKRLDAKERIRTLGDVIHNTEVVEALKRRGAIPIEEGDIPSLKPGETVFIRAHGVETGVLRQLEEQSAVICDGTCPYVKKIHTILDGLPPETDVYIFGDPSHPEIKGTKSHAKGVCRVFRDCAEAERFFAENKPAPAFAAVSQTTFSAAEWEKCRALLNGISPSAAVFDTICNTTEARQREVLELSRKCDLTVVIGGSRSSNTAKLFAIAKADCAHALQIETAAELAKYPAELFRSASKIAITAGASTPGSIIEEVITTMTDIIEDQSFEEMLDQSIKTLHTGEKVTGTISMVSQAEIHVDLGTKHTGILSYDEITAESGVNLEEVYHVGDPIEVVCLKFSDSEGTVMLSKRRLDADKNWVDIVAAGEDGAVLQGTVREITKGGVIVYANGNKIFVPASQTGLPREADLNVLQGKKVSVKIIEVNEERKRAVGSIRNAERFEHKRAVDEFYASVEVGQKFTGTVRSITDYGLFVNIGPVEGMVHITELSWGRLKKPSDLFKIGDTIDVYVKKIDIERHRISLGYKTEENNPWNIFVGTHNVGDVVDVVIVSIMPFGAFAEIIPGVDGLIHNSQIALKPVINAASVLAIGDKVTVKITAIEPERSRVSLSIRALLEEGEDSGNDSEEPVVYESAPEEK